MAELEAFVEIAETGNLLTASRRLKRTVRDMQASITAMEVKADSRLFQRAGTLRMTRTAKSLHPYAVAFVGSVRDLRRRSGDAQEGVS